MGSSDQAELPRLCYDMTVCMRGLDGGRREACEVEGHVRGTRSYTHT